MKYKQRPLEERREKVREIIVEKYKELDIDPDSPALGKIIDMFVDGIIEAQNEVVKDFMKKYYVR